MNSCLRRGNKKQKERKRERKKLHESGAQVSHELHDDSGQKWMAVLQNHTGVPLRDTTVTFS